MDSAVCDVLSYLCDDATAISDEAIMRILSLEDLAISRLMKDKLREGLGEALAQAVEGLEQEKAGYPQAGWLQSTVECLSRLPSVVQVEEALKKTVGQASSGSLPFDSRPAIGMGSKKRSLGKAEGADVGRGEWGGGVSLMSMLAGFNDEEMETVKPVEETLARLRSKGADACEELGVLSPEEMQYSDHWGEIVEELRQLIEIGAVDAELQACAVDAHWRMYKRASPSQAAQLFDNVVEAVRSHFQGKLHVLSCGEQPGANGLQGMALLADSELMCLDRTVRVLHSMLEAIHETFSQLAETQVWGIVSGVLSLHRLYLPGVGEPPLRLLQPLHLMAMLDPEVAWLQSWLRELPKMRFLQEMAEQGVLWCMGHCMSTQGAVMSGAQVTGQCVVASSAESCVHLLRKLKGAATLSSMLADQMELALSVYGMTWLGWVLAHCRGMLELPGAQHEADELCCSLMEQLAHHVGHEDRAAYLPVCTKLLLRVTRSLMRPEAADKLLTPAVLAALVEPVASALKGDAVRPGTVRAVTSITRQLLCSAGAGCLWERSTGPGSETMSSHPGAALRPVLRLADAVGAGRVVLADPGMEEELAAVAGLCSTRAGAA